MVGGGAFINETIGVARQLPSDAPPSPVPFPPTAEKGPVTLPSQLQTDELSALSSTLEKLRVRLVHLEDALMEGESNEGALPAFPLEDHPSNW